MSNEITNGIFPSQYYRKNESKGKNIDFTGVKANEGVITFYFQNNKYEIKASSIEEVVFEKHSLRVAANKYIFVLNENGKSRCFAFSALVFDSITFQSLVKYIININPKVKLGDSIKEMIKHNYVYSDKIHFDFKVHTKDSRDEIIINSEKVQYTVGLIFCLAAIILIIIFPIIGGSILTKIYGSSFNEYRITMLIITSLLIDMSLLNLLLALLSKYKGHKVTVMFLLLSVVAAVIAFI